jgi:hypothetical protein
MFRTESVMWAELRNRRTRVLVGSMDWVSLQRYCGDWDVSDERWEEATTSWRVSGDEAATLANHLRSIAPEACRGMARIDLNGPIASGSRVFHADDGLTDRERTVRLIRFLHKGEFQWRYVMEPRRPRAE